MNLGYLLLGFLQRIAMGAAIVFTLLLVIRLRMPRSLPFVASRRKTN